MDTLIAGDAGKSQDVAEFAAKWAKTIAGTSYVPMELPEIEAYLAVHVQRLFDQSAVHEFRTWPYNFHAT